MYILENVCNDVSFLATMLFIKKLVQIIFIITPILLILFLTIDFIKAIMANDESRMKHLKDVSVKRIVFAIALFFVPLIVDVSFGLLGNSSSKVISCYNSADNETVNRLENDYELDVKNKEASRLSRAKEIRTKQIEESLRRKEYAKNSTGNYAGSDVCSTCVLSEKIAQTAEALAWPEGTDKKKYDYDTGGKPYGDFKKVYKKWHPSSSLYSAACCCHSARAIVEEAINKKINKTLLPNTSSPTEAKKRLKSAVSKTGLEVIEWDGKKSSLKRGDIFSYTYKGGGGHVQIYLGNGKVAEGSRSRNMFSHVAKFSRSKSGTKWFFIIRG